MRALHLALVLLLVGSTAGAAVPAAQPSPSDPYPAAVPHPGPDGAGAVPAPGVRQADRPPAPPDSVSVLHVQPNVTKRSDLNDAYVDLGPLLRFGTGATSERLETLAAVERFEAAGNDEQADQLAREFDRIEARANALGDEQARLVGAYVRGERTDTELLTGLARIHREASALEERRQRLSRLAAQNGVDVDENRSEELSQELDVYTGPVRALAADALAGEGEPRRFYVAATPQGIVVATLTEETYLREAYRGDLRQTGETELSARESLEAVQREYPRVWAARERATFDGGRIGQGRVEYGNGTLQVAIASGNGRVFADEHRQALGPTASDVTATAQRDGLQLTVNRTYAGGPMRVELRDSSGARVDASVTVGPAGGESVTVGRTGNDGVLWTLTPEERYTVVAIRGQSVVFLTTDPLATPRPGTNRTAG